MKLGPPKRSGGPEPDSSRKIISLKGYRKIKPHKARSARTENSAMRSLSAVWTLMVLAIVVFWLASAKIIESGAWQWYVLIVVPVAVALFGLIRQYKSRKRLVFCIRCNKRVDAESKICPYCGAKVRD